MKLLLKILTIFVAVGAVGGAVMMWMDPSGMSWGGEPMLDLLCLWHYPDALDCIGMVDMGFCRPQCCRSLAELEINPYLCLDFV